MVVSILLSVKRMSSLYKTLNNNNFKLQNIFHGSENTLIHVALNYQTKFNKVLQHVAALV